jgi:hypothetical protein
MATRNKPFTIEQITRAALNCKSRSEFKEKYMSMYRAAIRLKILDQVCSHMKKLHIHWTNKMLAKEALKYRTRTEFAKKSNSAYLTATNRGILDRICAHMEYDHYPWTLGELKKIVAKYSTYQDLIKNDNAAYWALQRRKFDLDQYLKKSSDTSISEIEIFNAIKSFFPKTQKIKDRKVKIKGKSHINGFDIDIYVPELRKGIEFDGRYYHSFEGLKRARPTWPDEDLHNYHELKDKWFLSKNIQILHIKEEDWKDDRVSCILQIEEFLGITGFMSEIEQKVA